MPEPDHDPPSTPTLLYLAADLLLENKRLRVRKDRPLWPTPNWYPAALPVPFSPPGTGVELEELAGLLLAGALWDLRERGLLDLRLDARRRFLAVGDPDVARLRRVGAGGADGLAGALLAAHDGHPDRAADRLLRAWLPSRNPHEEVILTAVRDLEERGVLRGEVRPGALGNRRTVLVFDRWRLDRLDGARQDTARRWDAFRRDEPALAARLVADGRRAIAHHNTSD